MSVLKINYYICRRLGFEGIHQISITIKIAFATCPSKFVKAFFLNMKTIEKFTKEMVEGFILGNQASYERGDVIDPQKELTFIVTDSGNKFHIKAIWIKGVTRYSLINPMTDKDDVHHFEDYYFSISKKDTIVKASYEVHEALDYVNLNQFLNY